MIVHKEQQFKITVQQYISTLTLIAILTRIVVTTSRLIFEKLCLMLFFYFFTECQDFTVLVVS